MRVLLWLVLAFCPASLLAANGGPAALADALFQADIDQPAAVVADPAGRVYTLEGGHDPVALFSAEGRLLARFGEGLRAPLDMVLLETGLLIADTGNHRLVRYRPDGGFVKAYPLPESPEAGRPEPVAVAAQDGIAYWADRKSHRICRTRLEDGATLGCFGERGEAAGQFQYPYQIALDRDGYLNVVDILNARVQIFSRNSRQVSQISRFGLAPGELYRPNGLAIDAETDTLFVSDSYFGHIAVFRQGEFIGMLNDPDGKPVSLDAPTGLNWRNGHLYVAETGANRVHRYTVEYRESAGHAPATPAEVGQVAEPSRKNCLICHLSWASEAPPALRAADARGALPEASFRMCYSCHNGAVMDSRRAIHQGAQHPTVYETEPERQRHRKTQPRKDKLPETFPVTKGRELLCTACHTPHTDHPQPDKLYAGHENAWLRVPNQGGDLCERCHETKLKGARQTAPQTIPAGLAGKDRHLFTGTRSTKGQNHPLGIHFTRPPHQNAEGYATNPDLHQGLPARLAQSGAALGHDRELICQTCHQIHGGHGEGVMTVLDTAQGQLCSVCHARQHSADAKAAHAKGVHPVNIGRKSDDPAIRPVLWKGRPELTEVGCASCHSVHQGNPDTPLLPEGMTASQQLCKNCHERQHSDSAEEAHRKGVHPVNVKRDQPILWNGKKVDEVTCETCHKVHKGSPETALLPEGVAQAEALCLRCHERQHAKSRDEARQNGVHPVNARLNDPVEIAGQRVEKMGCLTCHAVHKGKPNTAALVEPDQDGQLCGHCHKGKQAVVGTDHDLRITARDGKNAHDLAPANSGVCGACHSLHRGQGERPFLFSARLIGTPLPRTGPDAVDETPFQRDALCLNCHRKTGLGEAKSLRRFSHPYQDLVLRSDPRIMPLLGSSEKPEEFGRIACVTCHEPHVWSPVEKAPSDILAAALSGNRDNREGTPLDSFLRHKGVTGTFCIDCHGVESLVKYKFFHDEQRARNRQLDYLR